jgi:hypothetical protein
MLFIDGPVLGLPLLYLDPGSGSFLIQLLLAVGLGLGVGVKLYWIKIKSLFSGKRNDTAQSPEEADEE